MTTATTRRAYGEAARAAAEGRATDTHCACGAPIVVQKAGKCRACYERARRRRPIGERTDLERFMAKVRSADALDCWIWLGGRSPGDYGQFYLGKGRTPTPAHRWSYEYFVAEIPDGLVIDHLCRVPLCVNPWHLEPVTIAENSFRGQSPAIQRWRENRCIRGHDLNDAYIRRDTGARMCRRCQRIREAAKASGGTR